MFRSLVFAIVISGVVAVAVNAVVLSRHFLNMFSDKCRTGERPI